MWLDVVLNHTDGWQKAPLYCFDGHCPNDSAGIYFFPTDPYASTPWGPRPNYIEPQVSTMLLASAAQWINEYHGDGFRIDSVSNIRALDGNGTTPGGRELLVALNDLTHKAGGFTVAEDLKGYDMITKAPANGGFGFDSQWDGFGYDIANLLVPYSDDSRDLGVVVRALSGGYAGDPFARLLWTENHDTVGNGGARLPTKIDPNNPLSFAARRRSMLASVLLLSTPGVPMLFMGQESLATSGFLPSPAPLTTPTEGQHVHAFYKDMVALRRNLTGGAGGLLDNQVEIVHRDDGNKVIAFRRHGASGEDVIVVLNLRNKSYARYDIGTQNAGTWRVRLNLDNSAYGSDFNDGLLGPVQTLPQPKDGKPNLLPLKLGAYGALVLTQ